MVSKNRALLCAFLLHKFDVGCFAMTTRLAMYDLAKVAMRVRNISAGPRLAFRL